MNEENNSKKAQIKKNIARQVIKKSMTPLMIVLGIVLVIIIILSVATWFLKKHDTKEDPNDPKNAPAAVRNFLNATSIDENGNITSAKSINEFWDELRRGGNTITKYLNSAEELSKLIYAARALDYPDTRPNPDLPINWDKIDLDSKEVQGIIKFKRALANGKTVTMSYVSPTKFQELISKYTSSGSEKDLNEVLKHFTMEKTASASSYAGSNNSNIEGKVPSLKDVVFMGDSILSMVSINSSEALEKEGAKTMYRGGTTAHYFLGTETSNALTNNCIEKNGHFDWDANFKDVTNPTGFYLMLGQNFHRADDRIQQMDELIKKIRSKYPNPPIYISSVLRLLDGSNTESIKQSTNRMNEELKKYCAENRNNKIYYSDVLREYDEGDESLHKHTYDDDHPNEEGARIIIKNIKENIIGTSTATDNGTGTTNVPRTYNNNEINVDGNKWVDPMQKMNPPYNNGSESREYRAIQSCCYDGRYAVSAQNKNYGGIDASSNGGRIIWSNLETGEIDHILITSEGGHMGEGITYDTERNKVIFHTGSGDFLEIDGNTKSISGHSKASEYPGKITYFPSMKQLVGVTEGELKFFKYDSSKNEYVKQSSVKMSEWPISSFQGAGSDGQCIYVFDSAPGASGERVWVYSLDGKLQEEHSLGSGFPRGKECESGFVDNNGNLWIATNHSIVKAINYIANPSNINPGSSSSTSTVVAPSDDFSADTRQRIMEHIHDFNVNNYDDFMNNFPGGYDGYMQSLGGVFAKYGGKGKKIQINNAGDLQEAAEFVWGLFSIWGFDYWNQTDYISWGENEKFPGLHDSAYYPSHSLDGRHWHHMNINDFCSDSSVDKLVNCNAGIDTFFDSTTMKNPGYGTMDKKGERIDRIEDLRVGDIIHFYKHSNETGWGHVAMVGEIDQSTGEVILYDSGRRFIGSGKYKIPLKIGPGTTYDGYEKWVGRRHFNLDQTSNRTRATTSQNNTTYQVKVATWSDNLDKVESNDPAVSSYDTGMVHNMTTTTIPYQSIVSKYKMPFNYLWTMLVYSNDKKYTFDLADLVKNSKIEITVHDNLNKNKTVVTDTYTDYTKIHAEADVNIEYEEKNTSTISTTNPTNNQPVTYTTPTTTTKNTSEHGKADGHTSVDYKVVHTTINNTNTLDIALTLADSWYTKYEKKYTYNGENTNESNSPSTLDNIVHDPVPKKGELGGLGGDVDSNAIAQAYNNITNIHNAHATGRSGEVATFQTTRQNRKKNVYTQTTTSSYSSSPGKNVDRSAIAIAETPKTGQLNTNNFVKLPEDRLDIPGIQQGFCLIDDEMYVTVMGNEDETCKLYLIDMTNFTQCDVISGLIGHGNTVTYDSVTGDVIFPEEHDTKLIHIDKASKKFENPRTVNTPADNSAYVAYNKQNDLFINQSDYKVYTREAFYSNGSSNVKFQYSKPDSELHLQGGGTYGNQVYVCYSHHGEGRYDDGNCIVVCNIHTGRQEKVIYDSTPRELEEVDFDKDGTMYAIYGGGGICVYKTDYNYYADNDIDKSNITPGMVTNQIARYNTGGEYDYDKSSFEKVFNAHYNARSNILSATEWLFEALEQNEDTSKMVDLTKYLLYKATGHDYGVTTFDFETYDPEGFNPVSTGIYGNTPQEKVWFALRNAGFSEYAVAGAMGNIEAESGGFNANAIEKGSGNGFGLCQWSFERRTRLEEYAKSKGKSPSDIEVQIEYLIGELTPGGGADGYAKFNFSSNYENWKNATSVEQATELYCRYFERPNMQYANMDRRKEAARKYYNEFHGKTAPTGSVGGGDILKACEETMQNYLSRGVHYSTNGGKLISGDIERCYNESNYICCATYVSSVLYKSGLLTPSQINKYAYHWTGDGGVPDMLKAAGWRQVSMDEIQPGDIVNNYTVHVLIYAGGDLYYDQGTCTVSSSGKAPTRSVKSGFNSSYRNSSYQVWRAPGK